jgi:hypothetical protein
MPDNSGGNTTILRRIAPGIAWVPRIVRENLTPTMLWSMLAALVTAVSFVVHAQISLATLDKRVAVLEEQRELLEKIDKRLDGVAGDVGAIKAEVDQQRGWRDRIEAQAEAPLHLKPRRPEK